MTAGNAAAKQVSKSALTIKAHKKPAKKPPLRAFAPKGGSLLSLTKCNATHIAIDNIDITLSDAKLQRKPVL